MARILSRALLLGAMVVALLAPICAALGCLDSLGAVGRFLGTPYAPLAAVLVLEFAHLWAGGGLRDLWALEPLFVREVAAQAKDRGLADGDVRKWREFREWLRVAADRVDGSYAEGHRDFLDYVIASEFVVRAFVECGAGWLSAAVFESSPDGLRAINSPATRAAGSQRLRDLRASVRPWAMRADAPWLADFLAEASANRARFVRVGPHEGA